MGSGRTTGDSRSGVASATRPRFSVVVPAFNAEGTLRETLDAVLAQTYEDWECVVVDDGSTDSTRGVATSFCQRDTRFSLIVQENRGTGGAYNAGVYAAVGAWISICSADDILLPRHLEVMASAIDRRPDCDIITCNGFFLKPDGAQELCYTDESGSLERSWTLEDLIAKCFYSVGACYRCDLRDRLGAYREDSYTEDYDFWLRAMAAGAQHLYIPDALAVHRITEGQKSFSLWRVFESDIQSIRSLLESGTLTRSQVRAAQSAIKDRERLIAGLEAPGPLARIGRFLRAASARIGTR